MFRVFVHDGVEEVPNDDIMYIIAKGGIYLKKKLGLVSSITPVDKISILQPVSTYAHMDIPKIPAIAFAQIMAFFKAVFDKHSSEAIVLLYYNDQKKKFWVRVPMQEVSGASLDYENFENGKDGFDLIGTIHSHGRMGAFHSSVDDKDEENFDGLHITIGDNDEDYPSISASIVVNGQRVKISPSDYVEGLSVEEIETIPLWLQYRMKNAAGWAGQFLQESYDKNKEMKNVWNLNVPAKKKTFPKVWMDFVSKKTYSHINAGFGTFPIGMGMYQAGLFGEDYNPAEHIRSGGVVIYDYSKYKKGDDVATECLMNEEPPCEECPHFAQMIDKVLNEYDFSEVDEDEDDKLPAEVGTIDPSFFKNR